ncbi:MAG: tetratricopeptide repeat protein [Sedimentisphaerales bacterium]|nr:tetratricopeptide repeat protein [Sedimentisphaerales bacterium]
MFLKEIKQPEEAREHFQKAIEGFNIELAEEPNSLVAISGMGVALVQVGQLEVATKYLQQAVNMNSYDVQSHLLLARTLVKQERYDEAIATLKNAVEFMSKLGDKKTIVELQKFIGEVNSEKSKANK